MSLLASVARNDNRETFKNARRAIPCHPLGAVLDNRGKTPLRS
jgi:hypothetical protein